MSKETKTETKNKKTKTPEPEKSKEATKTSKVKKDMSVYNTIQGIKQAEADDSICTAKGTFVQKIFKNPGTFNINSYKILNEEVPLPFRKKTIDGYTKIAVLGENLPSVSGVTVEFTGVWTLKPDNSPFATQGYQLQFKCYNYTFCRMYTKEGIAKFFKSSIFKGIGDKTAKKLAEYGKDVYDLIENNPDALDIPDSKKKVLVEGYLSNKILGELYSEYGNLGIKKTAFKEMIDKYGQKTMDVIKQNPYTLLEISGVGFKTCDVIASHTIDNYYTSDIRVRAGQIKALDDALNNDKCLCIMKSDLIKKASKILNEGSKSKPVSDKMIEDNIPALKLDNKIIESQSGMMYLTKIYEIQNSIAQKVSQRISPTPFAGKVEEELDSQSHSLCKEQKEAVINALSNKISIITGGPGTGKTTTIREIIRTFEGLNSKIGCYEFDQGYIKDEYDYENRKLVHLLAPTGKAARRMSAATNYEASTIHKGLRIYSDPSYMIRNGLVIIDEFSMVDVFMFNTMLQRIAQNCIIIIVGDKDQLPSIGPGAILKDLLMTKRIPSTELKQIFRQEGGSIVNNARIINSGCSARFDQDESFACVSISDDLIAHKRIVKEYEQAIEKFGVDNVVVLTPFKKETRLLTTTCQTLNPELRDIANPKTDSKELTFKSGMTEFRIGDRVMQTENCSESSNGDVGKIMAIKEDTEDGTIGIDIEWEDHPDKWQHLNGDAMHTITLAYAMTIHKSQGSEYSCVIIPMVRDNRRIPGFFTRPLLYTAVTRSKKCVVLVGEPRLIVECIKTQDSQNRYSELTYLIDKMSESQPA